MMGGSDGWGGWWLDGVDSEVVSAMEGWAVDDDWVWTMGCERWMDDVRIDDKGGEVRREGRETECDWCWGVIGVRVMGWGGLGV